MNPLALHTLHQALGASFTSVGNRELVDAYEDLAAEHRAARQSVALFDASARDIVQVVGEDRLSFLHGMVTNDVKGLPENGTAYAAMLTPKGAMVADCRVLRRKDDVLLDTEPGMGARLREFLEKYLISEDAELRDANAEWAILSLVGPRAKDLAPEGMPSLVFGPGGVDLLVPRAQLQATFERLKGEGATPIGFRAWETLRIENGVPRFGQDMDESTIPLEANLERAIHYSKGCYIGQEVIARATFRGHMNRKLTRLLLGALQPAPRTELLRNGKKVGWITSAVPSPTLGQVIALGYVHRDSLEPGTKLDLPDAPGAATVGSP
jgi:folate-binding protein YgfZ